MMGDNFSVVDFHHVWLSLDNQTRNPSVGRPDGHLVTTALSFCEFTFKQLKELFFVNVGTFEGKDKVAVIGVPITSVVGEQCAYCIHHLFGAWEDDFIKELLQRK